MSVKNDDLAMEVDSSPVTDQEHQEIEDALAEARRGEVEDWEDIKRKLG